MKGTAVVIPAFNEVRSVRSVAEAVLAQGVGKLIVVDDGSTDGTGDALGGLDLDLLVFPHNRGKGAALDAGMRHALGLGYPRILTLDADGQHRPADIPRLVAASLAHPRALTIGARLLNRSAAPWLRRLANRVADFWISWACARPIADTQSGLRLYPAALLAAISAKPRAGEGFAFETGILIDLVEAGAEILAVPVDTRYGEASRASHYRPWRDTWSIVRLVGAHLLRRGLYPMGLLRSLGLLPIPDQRGGPASSPVQGVAQGESEVAGDRGQSG